MTDRLDKEIGKIAEQVRRTDFLWAAGFCGGAFVTLSILSESSLTEALAVWGVFLLGLAIRYFVANVNWSQPVQRAVTTQLASFQRLRAVMNGLPAPVFLLTAEGVIELANPATHELVGTEPEGKYLKAVLRAPAISSALEDVHKSGQAQVSEFVMSDRVERHCRVYVTPLRASDDQSPQIEEEGRVLMFISDLSNERRLEKMRSDFIANASHELRTPLASMLGFIETLRGHAKDDPVATAKFLKIMNSQAKRMLRLVRDLMSLSSIELNEHMPPTDRASLLTIAEDVQASLLPVAEQYEGALRVENKLGAVSGFILGDEDELVQVVQNLADNALKYSRVAPQVSIIVGRGAAEGFAGSVFRTGESPVQMSARFGIREEDLLYIQVRDNGNGINRSDLPRLTERFYRADVEDSKARGGTGLGLAIVKHILNRHSAGLQIETAEGQGSAFTCYFRASVT